ncbi:MAG: hypothetical protein HYU63_02350, partial [Armatimonadetes bacterium]|nr:hypothetical protein [Armatimonadota bacterium]
LDLIFLKDGSILKGFITNRKILLSDLFLNLKEIDKEDISEIIIK